MSQIPTADPVLELPASSPIPTKSDEGSAGSGDSGGRTSTLGWVVLTAVWVICALYAYHYLRRGWVPHDEGTLGQSAERVLLGQLPHRDFDEVYSGGLSFLNAAAFRVLGTNLFALRLVLYLVFLAWVPAVYYVATRFTRPIGAGLVVLLATAWSLPTYSAAMPSWYNVFLATFGLAATLRYVDSDRPFWLLVAGIFGGLSCVIKIVGVYYVAAVLLFIVYREQIQSRPSDHIALRRTWLYSIFSTLSIALFMAVIVILVRAQPGPRELANFVAPILVLSVFLAWREWRAGPSVDELHRFRTLAGMALPLLLGVAIPIIVFLIPYMREHATDALLRGVFITPMKRFGAAFMHPPTVERALLAVILLPLSGIVRATREEPSWITRFAVGAGLVVFIVISDHDARSYRATWDVMRGMVPLVVIAGVWLLSRREMQLSPRLRQRLLLLLAACGLCALVQFPFAAPVYFFYVAPIAVLAGLAVLASWPGVGRLGPTTIAVFFLLFAVLRIHPVSIYSMGLGFARYDSGTRLAIPRGGIDIPPGHAAIYERLVDIVREHSRGNYIIATPDAPQVYFLTGLTNPTRTIYDFFDDPEQHDRRILTAIAEHDVDLVVVNRAPEFSDPVSRMLAARLSAAYPTSTDVGPFTVRWRE